MFVLRLYHNTDTKLVLHPVDDQDVKNFSPQIIAITANGKVYTLQFVRNSTRKIAQENI